MLSWDDLQGAARARGYLVVRVEPGLDTPALEAKGNRLWVANNREGHAALSRRLCVVTVRLPTWTAPPARFVAS